MNSTQWKALAIGCGVSTILFFLMQSVDWTIRRPFVIVFIVGTIVFGYMGSKE
jgi:hypothetical protein